MITRTFYACVFLVTCMRLAGAVDFSQYGTPVGTVSVFKIERAGPTRSATFLRTQILNACSTVPSNAHGVTRVPNFPARLGHQPWLSRQSDTWKIPFLGLGTSMLSRTLISRRRHAGKSKKRTTDVRTNTPSFGFNRDRRQRRGDGAEFKQSQHQPERTERRNAVLGPSHQPGPGRQSVLAWL